jgi:hypothetical protein
MTSPLPARRIAVVFRKQVSDGNYGTEAAEVHLEEYVEGDHDNGHLAQAMLDIARHLVHVQLRQSPSSRVRQSVVAPVERTPADEDEVPF